MKRYTLTNNVHASPMTGGRMLPKGMKLWVHHLDTNGNGNAQVSMFPHSPTFHVKTADLSPVNDKGEAVP